MYREGTVTTPPSFCQVREMAEYLGIDVKNEGYLLPLARMALQVDLSHSSCLFCSRAWNGNEK